MSPQTVDSERFHGNPSNKPDPLPLVVSSGIINKTINYGITPLPLRAAGRERSPKLFLGAETPARNLSPSLL
jgi:hypothetical protein